MYEYGIEFAGQTEKHNHMQVVRRPDIPSPSRRYTEKTIPGRDGKLRIYEEAVEDIEITIEFNFMGDPDEWFEMFRAAKKWLLQPGINSLILGDNKDFYYRVKHVNIETTERICHEIGKFSAAFICDGYEYLRAGAFRYAKSEVLQNPYETCRPTYYVQGNGQCTITVNGNSFRVNVNGDATIDSDLMLTYGTDGGIKNASSAGKYTDLYLRPGDNQISVSSGFGLEITPNWRCY